MTKNATGEGTIYKRKDGRYEAAVWVMTTVGTRKRLRTYAATRKEAHAQLMVAKQREQQGIPTPERTWTVSAYLDYWLEQIVKPNLRPTTYKRYETSIRTYLRPGLGKYTIAQLSVPIVQTFANQHLARGISIRSVQIMCKVLGAMLSQAQREELLTRNVARLVKLPSYEPAEAQHWSADETKRFLKGSEQDPLYPAFLLLALYGMRCGEVLGLRWMDIDLEANVVHIRQQVQRIDGSLQFWSVKTRAGKRDLPLLGMIRDALIPLCVTRGTAELVFATRTGAPIEPRNLSRSFHRLREQRQLRRIRLHELRHTQATLLKDVGAAAKDAQLILGHATAAFTQAVYQHGNLETRTEMLERVERLYLRIAGGERSRQSQPSRSLIVVNKSLLNSGAPGWARTSDLRLRSTSNDDLTDHLTSIYQVTEARKKVWLAGAVAVNVAVKNSSQSQEETA